MPEAGGAPTAASGQGTAEGLPALASPPLPQSGGEEREEEGGGSTLLPSLPAGGKGRLPRSPTWLLRLPSKRGSGLSSGYSMAGGGARRAAALLPPHMPGAGAPVPLCCGRRGPPASPWAALGAGPAFMVSL